MKTSACLLLLAASLCGAAERATYDSAGRVTSLIHEGRTLPVLGHFVLVLEDGREVDLQPHDQRSPIQREGSRFQWSGGPSDPLAQGFRFEAQWTENDTGVALTGAISTTSPRRVRSVDYVFSLPRAEFVGGQLQPAGLALPAVKSDDVAFFRGRTQELQLQDETKRTQVALRWDQPRDAVVRDHWSPLGRYYQVRIPVHTGALNPGETVPFSLSLALTGSVAPRSTQITIDRSRPRQAFHGFGANYCWTNTSPVIDYTLQHLQSTWIRFELKLIPWIAQRDHPGELLRRDFELMRQVQQAGHPWIISLWRLPEDYYVPQSGGSGMGHGRRIAPHRWDDFLRELGDFLLYAKQHYGAEPDMFSFNEPDLGVDIIFSADEHRDAIKRIGAHLASLGLKTKQLAGDTANPRERHLYVLPTAADPEAMQYVAGVSFHSWGGATPAQYAAWGDVAEWMQRPLFVGEAGMDPGAYRNRTYDSYTYGLREMKDHFDFVQHARVQTSLYWQFTNDYSLVRVDDDGSIQPTGRFHLMRHLNNLTPTNSRVVTTAADQADVQVLAFEQDRQFVVHILNPGTACRATVQGLPTGGSWKAIITTETEPAQEQAWSGPTLELPARSMVTLQRQ